MRKKTIWKDFVSLFTPDVFFRNDLLAGLGITTFAMIGIFAVSILFGLVEITGVGINPKTLLYSTGLTFIAAGWEEFLFRCILLTLLIKVFSSHQNHCSNVTFFKYDRV